MGFYFRVPLPGPFGYSKRIGGKRRRRPATTKRTPKPAYKHRYRDPVDSIEWGIVANRIDLPDGGVGFDVVHVKYEPSFENGKLQQTAQLTGKTVHFESGNGNTYVGWDLSNHPMTDIRNGLHVGVVVNAKHKFMGLHEDTSYQHTWVTLEAFQGGDSGTL